MDLAGEEEEPPRQGHPEMVLMYRSPWPTPRAYASNTGRSGCAGPLGLIELKNSAELNPHITDVYSDTRYDGMVIGPDDSIYIVKTDTKTLYVYKPGSALVETFSTGSARPPCFDVTGKMYVVEQQGQTLGADLVCYNEFPSDEAWRQSLPAGTEHSIMAAGDQIYTRTCGSQNSVQAWDKSGNKTCNINLPKPAVGVAEDGLNERFFIQISGSLYKLDYNGGQEWVVEGPGASYYEEEDEVWNALGPIVEWGGAVWVTNEGRELWKVFKPDGTEYKKGGSPIITGLPDAFSTAAVSAALGSNRLFYRALTGGGSDKVECYSDWDQPVWSAYVSGIVTDMVLDSSNHIYIGCVNVQDLDNLTYEWQCLDPDDGHVVKTINCAGVPSDICMPYRRVELAIGGDNQLVFLHKHGYVAVFGERQLEKELHRMEYKESSDKPVQGMRRKEG